MIEKTIEQLEKERNKYKALRTIFWGVILFVLLIIVDQATKIAADVYFSREGAPESIAIIPGWISLRITYNKGIAYGMGNDVKAWIKIAVIVGTAVLMAAFAVLYFKIDPRRTFLRVAVIFIIAGGVGNLIDRLYYQVWDPNALYGVRDMVDLSRFGFAVCNFADFFITGGAVMLVLSLLFFDRDALFPVGKKYKQLAKEVEEKKNALVAVNGKRATEDYEPRKEEGQDEERSDG